MSASTRSGRAVVASKPDEAEASSSAAAAAADGAGDTAGGNGVRMAPQQLAAWAGQLVQDMQGATDLAQAHARAGHLLQRFEGASLPLVSCSHRR